MFITTADARRQTIELNFELPEILFGNDADMFNGKAKTQHFQRFKLKPGTYIFSLEFPGCVEVNFHMKIGSVSECSFVELNEIETFLESFKN